MTERDPLARVTAALREETRPHNEGMDEALSRLRWAAPAPRRGVRKFAAPLLAAAFALGGAVAWASTTGHLQQWAESIADYGIWSGKEASQGRAVPDTRRAPPEQAPEPAATATATPAPIATDLSEATEPAEPTELAPYRPPAVRLPAPPAPAATASTIAPATRAPEARRPEVLDADAAYRRAHRLHFTRKDYAAALSAWNEYLRVAPAGDQWLPEARFNRAIALHRLGRHGDARRALEPFASGVYGGYRRDEAKRLIEQLQPSDKP